MSQETKSKPTIEDVAKHCGVSVATVSRVINGSSPVRKNLQKKVQQAIQELGFTPRSWVSRSRPEKVGIVIPNILNPFYSEIIHGAQEEADRQRLNLVVVNVTEDPGYQKQHVSLLKKWGFDGLLVMGTSLELDLLVKLREQENIPIVITVRKFENPQFPCIVMDAETAMYQATKHLLSLGHSRIAYISGPPKWISSGLRLESIKLALSEAGLDLQEHLHRWCFPKSEEGAQMTSSLLDLPENRRPTAIMAFNDLLAIGALHTIHVRGMRVPEDMSVVGFDDIAMASYTVPPLTTIAQPAYRMGRLSVQKLAEAMKVDAPDMTGGLTLLKCPFVVRESTGPCPE